MEINIEKEVSLFTMKTFNVLSNLAFKGLGLKCESVYCETWQGNHLCVDYNSDISEEIEHMCEDIKIINAVSTALLGESFRNALEVLQGITKENLHFVAGEAEKISDEILNCQEKNNPDKKKDDGEEKDESGWAE